MDTKTNNNNSTSARPLLHRSHAITSNTPPPTTTIINNNTNIATQSPSSLDELNTTTIATTSPTPSSTTSSATTIATTTISIEEEELKEIVDETSIATTPTTKSISPPLNELEQFLLQTLSKNTKDRHLMLRIEADLKQFLKDETQINLNFPSMSSYQRMLVHRISSWYGLEHNLESLTNCVVVGRKDGAGVPERGLRELEKIGGNISSGSGSAGAMVNNKQLPCWTHHLSPTTTQQTNPRLLKVESFNIPSSHNQSRPYISTKSYSFGGYHGNHYNSNQQQLVSGYYLHGGASNSRAGSYSRTSTANTSISPASSGYKSTSFELNCPSPPPLLLPGQQQQVSQQILCWAVTSIEQIPPGVLLIDPGTGSPYYNPDGSIYYFDPNRPPEFKTTNTLQQQQMAAAAGPVVAMPLQIQQGQPTQQQQFIIYPQQQQYNQHYYTIPIQQQQNQQQQLQGQYCYGTTNLCPTHNHQIQQQPVAMTMMMGQGQQQLNYSSIIHGQSPSSSIILGGGGVLQQQQQQNRWQPQQQTSSAAVVVQQQQIQHQLNDSCSEIHNNDDEDGAIIIINNGSNNTQINTSAVNNTNTSSRLNR